jgi:hypothetical protein
MKDDNNIHKLLEKLSPRPLPQQIRERILLKAYQRERKFQALTPVLRWVLAGSCVLIAMAFVFDTAIKNRENSRLTAMMDGSQATEILRDQELQDMIRELFKIEYNQNLGRWLIRHQKAERKAAKLLDYQRLMDILKE